MQCEFDSVLFIIIIIGHDRAISVTLWRQTTNLVQQRELQTLNFGTLAVVSEWHMLHRSECPPAP